MELLTAPVTVPLWFVVACIAGTGASCFVIGLLTGIPIGRRDPPQR